MWFVIGLVLLFVALGLVFRVLERGLVYHPEPLPIGRLEVLLDNVPDEGGETWEEAVVPTADGEEIVVWLGVPRDPLAWLIWFHGNAGHNEHRFPDLLNLVRRCRLATALVEYRGYGASSGKPDEPGLYLDARAARELVLARGATPDRLFYLGRSLGGAVAVELAAAEPPRGLILESTFTSAADMARHLFPWFPVAWFTRSRFETEDRIARLAMPILLLHGREDELIPLSHGERLAAAARRAQVGFVPVEDAGHNDVSAVLGREYFRAVAEFVKHCLSEE